VEAARCLARRLEALPQLRAAVALGQLSWSMGELLTRVANEQNEGEWLQLAQGRTLREVQLLCQGKECEGKATSADAAGPDESERCTLTCNIGQEESWLFEATRALLESLGTRDASEQIEALLAEGQDTLLAALPRGALDLDELELVDRALERWQDQLRRWRAEGWRVCMFFNNEGEIERFHELIRNEALDEGFLETQIGQVTRGFSVPGAKLAVLSDAEIFGRYKVQVPGTASRIALSKIHEAIRTRPKLQDGTFKKAFDVLSTHGTGFIEGNAWNYSLYVPQDPDALIRTMGGPKRFVIHLDSLFTMYLPDKFFAETAFIIYFVQASPVSLRNVSDVGLTSSIGGGLFTTYLLPFEITSILLLMAIVGAMTLARTGGLLSPRAAVVPGDQVFSREMLNRRNVADLTPVITHSTDEAKELLGVKDEGEAE